ncbi:deoxyribose-phosphate aldolase [Dyadobacter luticola]|uniref:Deoxyribose-phosphate aldolase n=1 Tax=Dyadobacter luticola TaxID=1979387 RepID=A0A5R9KUX4_9BACT|nr:deoxyribose-phosphate aldolase [Dyadobacter luticola]TLV00086.1 deoxyribose-phosphate aldolase [Dyadobacter luticola]
MTDISSYIDHTQLSPAASETDIRKLCEEAWLQKFKGICVAPTYVPYAVEMLEFCPIRIEIVTVIGYPFGFSTTTAKVAEAAQALKSGATELEVVMNFSQFKSMAYLSVREELQQISEMVHAKNALLTIILETDYLDTFDLYTVSEICMEAKADFVKPSTGLNAAPDPENIKKLRALIPANIKIKAAGNIETYDQAVALIEAGADRLGTSSGIAIVAGK